MAETMIRATPDGEDLLDELGAGERPPQSREERAALLAGFGGEVVAV